MYVLRQYPLSRALRWSWPIFPIVGAWAGVLVYLKVELGVDRVELPVQVLGVLGTAVSFYLGFKGNAAYGRLWEARKIWGGIVNASRTWGMQVLTLITELHGGTSDPRAMASVHRELIDRHIAWLAALRIQLRRRVSWEHDDSRLATWRRRFGTDDQSDARVRDLLGTLIPHDELEAVMRCNNRATQLVLRQGERLRDLYADSWIEDFRHMDLVSTLSVLYELQGKCERIKNFPLPRQYASANHWFVWIFVATLPLGLLDVLSDDRAWMAVPASMLVGWVFYIWNFVLDLSENPFEGLINDIPMDSMSRSIEIDLREMLGDSAPAPISAIEGEVAL